MLIYLVSIFLVVRCVDFELCFEKNGIYCVKADSDIECDQCYSSISDVLGNWTNRCEGNTILLVGTGEDRTTFTESVTISIDRNHSCPENYTKTNEIRPYPGHNIRWRSNYGEMSILEIKFFWWKISGRGGHLELYRGLEDVTLHNFISVASGDVGIILEDFTLTTEGYHENNENLNMIIDFHGGTSSIYGVLIQGLTFVGGNYEVALNMDRIACYQEGLCPQNSSFVLEYGEQRRVWVRDCVFSSRSIYQISASSFTIESNYFLAEEDYSQFFIRNIQDLDEGVDLSLWVYNNVFEVKGAHLSAIYVVDYNLEFQMTSLDYLIFNNLILSSKKNDTEVMVLFNMLAHELEAPRVSLYNNVFEKCIPLAGCFGGEAGGRANTFYSYNNVLEMDCEWNQLDCNPLYDPEFYDLGMNSIGGEYEIRYEDDQPAEVLSMSVELLGSPFYTTGLPVLSHDKRGMARPGNEIDFKQRISRGPFECRDCLFGIYPLCDDVNTLCVEVDPDYPCMNCRDISVNEVLKQRESNYNITVYLVGNNDTSSHEPTLYSRKPTTTLTTGVTTRFEWMNVVKPYLNHSIVWEGHDDEMIYVESSYWRITGEGGSLIISQPSCVSVRNFSIIYAETGGLILDNVEIINNCDSIRHFIEFSEDFCNGGLLYGIDIHDIVFRESEDETHESTIKAECDCGDNCGGMIREGFTDHYGEDKLVWIHNNEFLAYPRTSHLRISAFTVDTNLFRSTKYVENSIIVNLIPDYGSTVAGVSIYNNIFWYHRNFTDYDGTTYDLIRYIYLNEDEFQATLDFNVYNNDIIDDFGGLLSFILFDNSNDQSGGPHTVYIYNNLVQREVSGCVASARCISQCSGRTWFGYNTQTICSYKETKGFCEFIFSNFINGGHNYQNDDLFESTWGTDPSFPDSLYLKDNLVGFEGSVGHPIPKIDYEGRERANVDFLGRATRGAFESKKGMFLECGYIEGVVCVEVTDEYGCINCDSTSVQEAVSMTSDISDGGNVIYLVGRDYIDLTLKESVVLNVSSKGGESYLSANVLAPYPGHKIYWQSASDESSNLRIETNWWKITRYRSTSTLYFQSGTSGDHPTIVISTGGVLIDGIDFGPVANREVYPSFPVDISFRGCSDERLLGIMIKDVYFHQNICYDGVDLAPYNLDLGECFCGRSDNACHDNSSFVTDYGLENRILVQDCHFRRPIRVHSFTYQSNAFVFDCMDIIKHNFSMITTFPNFVIEVSFKTFTDNLFIFNNYFVTKYLQEVVIANVSNDVMGDTQARFNDEQYIRFFNNDIYADYMSPPATKSLILFDFDEQQFMDMIFENRSTIPKFLIYNNYIQTLKRIEPFKCVNQTSDTKKIGYAEFSYNLQYCTTFFDLCEVRDEPSYVSNCEESEFSTIIDLGHNIGPSDTLDWVISKTDLLGMRDETVGNYSSKFFLSEYDWGGRARKTPDGRTSVGRTEFTCGGGGLLECDWNVTKWCQVRTGCSCLDDYFGDACQYTTCREIYSNDTLNVCHGRGVCNINNYCDCSDIKKYWGKDCEQTMCFGIDSSYDLVCSGHGTCSAFDTCDCIDEKKYHYGGNCGFSCFGVYSEDQENAPCSSFGRCIDYDECDCLENYLGENCNVTYCSNGAFLSNESSDVVCSGHGICNLTTRNCECESDWSFEEGNDPLVYNYCNITKCFGELSDRSLVCNHKGYCHSFDTCNCVKDYYGQNCEEKILECQFTSSKRNVLEMYYFTLFENNGNNFQLKTQHDVNIVQSFNCSWVIRNWRQFLTYNSSHCVFEQAKFAGYWFLTGLRITIIEEWEIDSLELENEYYYDLDKNFTLDFITLTRVPQIVQIPVIMYTNDNDDDNDDDQVPDTHDGEDGEEEEEKEKLSSWAIFIIIFSCLICICVCFCLLCVLILGCLICFLCGLIISGFSFIGRKQRKRLSKLDSHLGDEFEILLHEQLLEKNEMMLSSSSKKIAHLTIDKSLFEIEYSEVKIDQMIGSGGSEAVIFKGTWRNIVVAFKVFKTMQVCRTQENFDRFQQELSILANLNHPNIINFWGASLKPPRVGIVMEYCENGEILEFIVGYRNMNENDERYPVKEKIRMAHECVSGIEYLHSRNVIHRDLKCENVLINKLEMCKLSDFGISRVIEEDSDRTKTKCIGTSVYMAPELTSSGKYGNKVDSFSFGILLYIIFTENNNPYDSVLGRDHRVEFRVAVDPSFRPDLESPDLVAPPWIKRVMKNLWSHNPSERLSFGELLIVFEKREFSKPSVDNQQKLEEEEQQEEEVRTMMEKSENCFSRMEDILSNETLSSDEKLRLRKMVSERLNSFVGNL